MRREQRVWKVGKGCERWERGERGGHGVWEVGKGCERWAEG